MERSRQEVQQAADAVTEALKATYSAGIEAGVELYRVSVTPHDQDQQLDMRRIGRRSTIASYDRILSEPDKADPIQDEARKRADRFLKQHATGNPVADAEDTWRFFAQEITALDTYKSLHFELAPGKTTCVRAYSEQLASYLGWGIAAANFGHPESSIVRKIINVYAQVGISGTGDTGWVGMKLNSLQGSISEATLVLGAFAEFDPMTDTEVSELQDENNHLWQESKKLAKYGLASVIAPTNLVGINEWSVISGYDVRAKMTESLRTNQDSTDLQRAIALDLKPCRYGLEYAAGLFTATNGRFTHSDPQVMPLNAGENYLGSHLMLPVAEEGPNDTAPIMLDQRGELKTLTGTPLRDMCERLGCVDAYEQLRSEILALHFDLVVPITVTKAISSADREAVEANTDWRIKDRLRYLVIARRKYLYKNRKDIVDELKREQQLGGGDRLGVHQVGGHVREIASNHQASDSAREWAWIEKRVRLAPYGETWVHTYPKSNKNPGPTQPRRALVVSGEYATRQAARKQD